MEPRLAGDWEKSCAPGVAGPVFRKDWLGVPVFSGGWPVGIWRGGSWPVLNCPDAGGCQVPLATGGIEAELAPAYLTDPAA